MRISDWSSDVCSSDLIRDPSYPSNFRLLQVRVDDGNALTGVFACLDGSSARRRRTLFVNNLSPATDTQTQTQTVTPTFTDLGLAERSKERRVGKDLSVRVDLGGRRIIKKKKKQ